MSAEIAALLAGAAAIAYSIGVASHHYAAGRVVRADRSALA